MSPLTRTIVYIDVFKEHNDIVAIKYYTARVAPTPADPNVSNRQDAYLRALKETCPMVTIQYGHFLRHEVSMHKTVYDKRVSIVAAPNYRL